METMKDFIFLGLQNHLRWWLQSQNYKMLASWNKSYNIPRQCIKKQRQCFANKSPSSQSYGFSSSHVWMGDMGHKEGWASKLMPLNWCWRRLLRIPWTAGRSNQSILEGINLKYSLEGLMLKLQYFGPLIRRTDSFEKTLILGRLKAGGEGDDRGWDDWIVSPTGWTRVWVNSRNWWQTGKPGVL